MIYLGCATLLLADTLFMLFNFKYSHQVYMQERGTHVKEVPKEERKIRCDILFEELGLYRSIVKTYIYWFWFIAGFFTVAWAIHLMLFIVNLLHEISLNARVNISTFSFFFKLFLYLSVYLTTIITLLTSY